MVNRTKLLDMVRRTPGIRTVQLCDQLDCPIDEVEEELAEAKADGAIRSEEVMAPNNRKATGFWLAGPVAAAAASVLVKKRTKVDTAEDFIRQQPGQTATSEQLAKLLCIITGDVAAYLGGGIKSGRLVKDGKKWTLGVMAPDAAPSIVPTNARQALGPDPVKTTVHTEILIETPIVALSPSEIAAAENISIEHTTGISTLLHSKWEPDPEQPDCINGTYHGTDFLIFVPMEMRAELLALQNRIYMQVEYVKELESELVAAKQHLSSLGLVQ